MHYKIVFLYFILINFFITPIAQAQVSWIKSIHNPVVPYWSGNIDDPSGYKYAFEPSVLYDSSIAMYRMWFTSLAFGYGTRFVVSSAVSPDGIDWYLYSKNPVLQGGNRGSFDVHIHSPRILQVDGRYLLYYTGRNNDQHQIGLASSSDGKIWEKYSGNPVLKPGLPGTWDSKMIGWCTVLYKDNTFYMWYNGKGTKPHWEGIGLATSRDGIHWTKHPGNPIFVKSDTGWDSYEVSTPTIVFADNTFYMIYHGQSAPGPYSFGWAYSKDGIHLTRGSSNPILTPVTGWEALLGTASVVFRDKKFHLWYSGRSSETQFWQIGYAVSDKITNAVTEQDPTGQSRFELSQSYPNPFNPTTNIRYVLPHSRHVTLKVYDLLGQELQVLVDEVKPAGVHTVTFSGEQNSSGTYFCRFQAGDFVTSTKLILLK